MAKPEENDPIWEENRKHWAIYRQSTGFYSAMPIGWGDDYIIGPIDWAVANNQVKKVNAVRSWSERVNDQTFEKLLSVYDILVERGDIKAVELLKEPEAV